MHETRREARLVEFHRGARPQFHILESVVGEIGRPRLAAFAFQNIGVGLEIVTRQGLIVNIEIAHLDAPRRLHEFAVGHCDLRAALALDLQAAEARKVDAEIEHPNRVAERTDPDRLRLARGPNSGHRLGFQQRRRGRDFDGLRPRRIVESGTVPAGNLPAGVVNVAAVNVIREVRTVGRRAPRTVGADDLVRTVGIVDVQFADHPRTSAPAGHLETPRGDGLNGIVKPVAQHSRKDILALAEPVRNVVHGIEIALVVMGVTRVEEISRNGFTVQAHFRIGRGAHIEPGALDARPHGERPPQHRRGDEILVMGIGDPASLPFGGLHQGGFELRNGRYDPPAAGVPRFDPPVIRGPRDKQSAVGHRGKRTAAGDLPGIPDVGMIQFLERRSHAEAVTGLHERIGIFISPGKARRRSVHRDRRSEVFATHVGDRGTLPAGTRQQRQAAQREPASGGSEICNIHRIRKLLGFYRFQASFPTTSAQKPSLPTPKRRRYSTGVIRRWRRNMLEK